MDTHRLLPWPDPALPKIEALTVRTLLEHGQLHLRYALKGDLGALLVPPPAVRPAPHDGLWQHTCFEAFVGAPGSTRYLEFNFSPSGDWAGYAFSAPRVRSPDALGVLATAPVCTRGCNVLTLEVCLSRTAFDWPLTTQAPLGFNAVLEDRTRRLSYWALCHPGARPDFHDRRGWTARLSEKDAVT